MLLCLELTVIHLAERKLQLHEHLKSLSIHFVEVKARQKSVQAPPQDNVGALKQKRIVKAALRYLNTKNGLPGRNMDCFFDVVAVTYNDNGMQLEWIPNAYIPLYI